MHTMTLFDQLVGQSLIITPYKLIFCQYTFSPPQHINLLQLQHSQTFNQIEGKSICTRHRLYETHPQRLVIAFITSSCIIHANIC